MLNIEQGALPSRLKSKQQIAGQTDMKGKIDTAKSKVAVHLSSRGLPAFPPEILKMTHLRVVNLGMNNIENLPAEIANLKGLTVSLGKPASVHEPQSAAGDPDGID